MFIDPVLGVRLTSMGMSEDNVGFAFAIIGFSFGFGAPIAGAICEKVSKVVVMQTGQLLIAFSLLLMGPSILFGLPDQIWLMMIGIFFVGFFGAFLFVPVTPEIIEATALQLRN
jgi:predicted MFS family arabinose efflux permease